MVPRVGLEPTRCRHHRILSPARLPFRHPGTTGRQYKQSIFLDQRLLLTKRR